jgi:rubrerythrin
VNDRRRKRCCLHPLLSPNSGGTNARQEGDPATGEPIGDSVKNLKAAITGETYEYTQMYPGFAKAARDEGFEEIAEWFETLARAERSHAGRFQNGLDNLTGK